VKGLILSGGAGTRLRPLTHSRAKQLVPVANKPILFYGIEQLAKAGIKEIGIIVGETEGEIRKAVEDGQQWDVRVTYIPQEKPLGLAHCVLIAKDFLGEEDFVMYLGDNMLEQDLSPLVHKFKEDRIEGSLGSRILLKEVENPKNFGVAEIDDNGKVIALVEKPENPISNLALVGVYFFSPIIHDAVAGISPSKRGELEITDAIQQLMKDGKTIDYDILDGWWIDTGKKDPLLESNRQVLKTVFGEIDPTTTVAEDSSIEGQVKVGADCKIVNSSLEGPIVIGNNATIQNSYIGPFTSVGDGCKVIDSSISDSVLMPQCSINKSHYLTNSLIGNNCRVTGPLSDEPCSLMIGDDSVLDLP
tara:strand:+ start:1766 stop:2845 length:1080 start_codon:yes stop_codon:yes gene_type:complete